MSKKGLFAARAKCVPQFIPRNRTVRQHATHCQVPPDVWVGCCLSRRAAPDPLRPLELARRERRLPRYNGHSCLRASRQVLGRSGRRSINKSTADTGFSTGNRRAVQANHRFDRQITAVNEPSLPGGKFERTSRVRPGMDGHVVQHQLSIWQLRRRFLWLRPLSSGCGEDRREAFHATGRPSFSLDGRC
jgi:hypothetical protein